MNRSSPLFSILGACALLAAPTAFAQGRSLAIEAPTHAQLTMAQAVVVAESLVKGRATGARLDKHTSQQVYRVTVEPVGEPATTVEVAAAGGRIVASERRKD